jgi:hypothetical protein
MRKADHASADNRQVKSAGKSPPHGVEPGCPAGSKREPMPGNMVASLGLKSSKCEAWLIVDTMHSVRERHGISKFPPPEQRWAKRKLRQVRELVRTVIQ